VAAHLSAFFRYIRRTSFYHLADRANEKRAAGETLIRERSGDGQPCADYILV
jgi:hypothetical protein